MHKVYIILVNWNGWQDTIECLESIFRNDYPRYQVIVCDNGSEDNSMHYIREWANGNINLFIEKSNPLRGNAWPPVKKPIAYLEYKVEEIASSDHDHLEDAPLVLIQINDNRYWAGGNNVGMKYALKKDDFEYVWLLNIDTVIQADALSEIVRKISSERYAGMCGSTLAYYHAPEVIQALGGGTHNRWLGLTRHLGARRNINENIDVKLVQRKMDYVVGASMLVTRALLRNIGLLNEEYCIYYEEFDWAISAREKFSLTFAPKSIVYHKVGAIIGSGINAADKSILADYYSLRNRLLITRKFFPYALPTVYLGLLVTMLRRILRGQWNRLGMILRIALGRDRK